ncbi:hypothetical protein MPER_12706 [Moniliophthora perniciosa FA553]|nr:hypothetical protein MPER_12706 [Moniliophthora perniciosa FA553]
MTATANELRYLLHWGTYNELLLTAARTQHRVEPVMHYAIGLVREQQVLQQQTAHVRSHLTALDNLLKFTEERIDSATDFMASCNLQLDGHLLVPLHRFYNIELANIPHVTPGPNPRDDNWDPNTPLRWYPAGIINPPSPAPSIPPADPISPIDHSALSNLAEVAARSPTLPPITTIKSEPTPESVSQWKLEYPDDTVTFDNDGTSCQNIGGRCF